MVHAGAAVAAQIRPKSSVCPAHASPASWGALHCRAFGKGQLRRVRRNVTRPLRDELVKPRLVSAMRRAASTSLRSATDAPPGCVASHSQCLGNNVIARAITPSFGRPRARGTGSTPSPLVAPHLEITDASGRIVKDQHSAVMRLGVFDRTPDHARHVARCWPSMWPRLIG